MTIHWKNWLPKNSLFLFALFTLFFVTWTVNWGLTLVRQHAIVQEHFEVCPGDRFRGGLPDTNHTVDLPLTTNYSCQNMCGPQARCSKTGEQCTSDIDCLGCRPTLSNLGPKPMTQGFNHAGKLLASQMPSYSVLTTDMARESLIYEDQVDEPPPDYFKGLNTWKLPFETGLEQYEHRYAPSVSDPEDILQYTPRYTLSGEFVDDGPMAANAYLNGFE